MKRFGGIIHQLEDVSMDYVMQAMKQVVRLDSQLFSSISLKPSESIDKMFERANKYSTYEDDLAATSKLAMAIGDGTAKSGHASSQYRCVSHDSRHPTPMYGNTRYGSRRKDSVNERNEVRFIQPMEKILLQADKEVEFEWLTPLWKPADERVMGKLCDYHKDHGHNTEQC